MKGFSCPECGTTDLDPFTVDRDGNVTLFCRQAGCEAEWTARTVDPDRLPTIRELGARLDAARRQWQTTPRDLHVSRFTAKGAYRQVGREIIEVLT